MISTILTTYAKLLEQYLNSFFHQPEGLVEVGAVMQEEDEPNKLIISLLNIERETGLGVTGYIKRREKGVSALANPEIHANLLIVLAAVFRPKRYKESLSVISETISFLQSTTVFTVNNTYKYSIEPVTLSWQDQSNIWTGIGGKYYPSVVCKIRGVTFDAGEMKRIVPDVKEPRISLE